MASWFESYGDDFFDSLSMKALGKDDAYLRINNKGSQDQLYLLKSHRECVECDYSNLWKIFRQDDFIVHSNYKYKISRTEFDTKGSILCDLSEPMGEFGVYNVTVDDENCIFQTEKEPVNIYLPMITVAVIYALLCLIVYAAIKLIKTKKTDEDTTENLPKKARIKSLDTFRGISIVTMIFVNMGAGGYDILDHAAWNGFHLADFVFPCFLWIMGACIPISLTSSFKKGIPNKKLISSVAKRSLKLFCIGVFLSCGIYLDRLRVMGVLQRFGVCYFVVSLICIATLNRAQLMNTQNTPQWFTSLTTTFFGWIISLGVAVIHTLIIFLVTEGNCERGYLGPGGLHQHGLHENCTGGATGFLDRAILGNHVYHMSTISDVYNSQLFDPEGLVGCLTSIFHTFIGVQAGVILLVHKDHRTRLTHWMVWALICFILGGTLCGFSKEDGWIPINKNLWSLSFVFAMSTVAFLLLSICYVLIDMKNYWRGQPFFYAGMNSILMYIGHSITGNYFPFVWRINNDDYTTPTHFLILLSNVTATAIWMYIAYYLYKIKYFFTV